MPEYLSEEAYIQRIRKIDPVHLNIPEKSRLELLDAKRKIRFYRNALLTATLVVFALTFSAPHLRQFFSLSYAGLMAYFTINLYITYQTRKDLYHRLYQIYRQGSGQISLH